MAAEMIIVHNVLIRLINSVYLQAVKVASSPEHVPGFLHYTKGVIEAVQLNRPGEGREGVGILAAIERATTGVKGRLGSEVEQHRGFERGLDELEGYLGRALEGEEAYDGEKMTGMIDRFMPVLREHLVDEVKTLLTLEEYEERVDWVDWDAWFHGTMGELEKHGLKGEAKFIQIPLALQGHDAGFGEGIYDKWPGLNLLKFALDWLLVPKHKEWWVFCPCDTNMQPRELPFA